MLDVFLKTGIYFLLVLARRQADRRLHEEGLLEGEDVPGSGARSARAPSLPRRRRRRLEGAGLRRVRGLDDDLQRRQPRRPLRDGAAAAPPAAESRQDAGRPGRARLEHGDLVHDEHELAGLLGRIDDVALHPDGGPRRPQLRVGGHGHRDRDRLRARASRGSRRRASATSGPTSCAPRSGSSCPSASPARSS